MPPLPKIQSGPLEEMVGRLRDEPREAMLGHIERAERLAAEIDPAVAYPADWVVFRVTGDRPEMDNPPLVPGEALLADLSAVVERLCAGAGLREEEVPAAEPVAALAERWSVSVKTISRWRRRGLIARRVHDGEGGVRLVVTPGAAAAWADRQPRTLQRAAGFQRIDEREAASMVRRARRYHDLLGWTRTQCAARLAERFGRSREAVRQVLTRHDDAARADGGDPVFAPARRVDAKTRRVIERAWRRGLEPQTLGKRYGRSRAGIHRIVSEQRLERLGRLELGRVAPDAAALDDPDIDAVLGAAPVRSVELPAAPADMLELLAFMRERVVPVAVEERAWSRAEHVLRARAARCIASAGGDFPEASLIDRAETDLRWAAGLRAALARPQLLLMLETLESIWGVRLDAMRGAQAAAAVEAGLEAVRSAIDVFDPWKSGRLAARVGLAAARVRATPGPDGVGRARLRLLPGTPAPDWTLAVSPWAAAVRPDGRVAPARAKMPPELAAVLTERFGLDGQPPRTLAELAASRGVTIMQAGRLERRAVREARAVGRG